MGREFLFDKKMLCFNCNKRTLTINEKKVYWEEKKNI